MIYQNQKVRVLARPDRPGAEIRLTFNEQGIDEFGSAKESVTLALSVEDARRIAVQLERLAGELS